VGVGVEASGTELILSHRAMRDPEVVGGKRLAHAGVTVVVVTSNVM